MAKNLKQIKNIILRSKSNDPNSYDSCEVSYQIGHSDDAGLLKDKSVIKELSGDDLEKAQDLWDILKEKIEDDEGLN